MKTIAAVLCNYSTTFHSKGSIYTREHSVTDGDGLALEEQGAGLQTWPDCDFGTEPYIEMAALQLSHALVIHTTQMTSVGRKVYHPKQRVLYLAGNPYIGSLVLLLQWKYNAQSSRKW